MMRLLRYLWAGPTTLLGLSLVCLVWLTRGKVRVHRGVVEASGGWLIPPIFLKAFPWVGPIGAMALGHTITGLSEGALDGAEHEHVHIRQCERWGPFFLPAYYVASIIAVCRGGNIYTDNCFEREAYGTS